MAKLTPLRTARSSLAEVRNPMLRLDVTQRLLALPTESREVIRDLMRELSVTSRAVADKSWNAGKAPMATYWRATGIYAGHISKAINRSLRDDQKS